MSDFWIAIFGVIVGGCVTTIGHLVIHHFQTAQGREFDQKRKAMLTKMLENPGPQGWREMETLSSVIGATREDTARLLIELNARASETGNDAWALISEKPLPSAKG